MWPGAAPKACPPGPAAQPRLHPTPPVALNLGAISKVFLSPPHVSLHKAASGTTDAKRYAAFLPG